MMKDFEITTTTKCGKYVFLTKAMNGKKALKNLITRSSDFKIINLDDESNLMKITIKRL